jgi:hypothetical protein
MLRFEPDKPGSGTAGDLDIQKRRPKLGKAVGVGGVHDDRPDLGNQ